MTIVDYALVTLEDTKSFLGITSSTYDDVLTMLINMATDHIEKRCGRRFADTTYTEEEYDGTAVRTLAVKNFPITSTTTFKLEKNNACDNTDDWEEIDSDEYWVDSETGIITRTTSFAKRTKNFRVTYSAGYDEIPYDLQLLTMTLISEIFNNRRTGGVLEETLGDRTVKFQVGTILDNSDEFKNILANYRKIPV